MSETPDYEQMKNSTVMELFNLFDSQLSCCPFRISGEYHQEILMMLKEKGVPYCKFVECRFKQRLRPS